MNAVPDTYVTRQSLILENLATVVLAFDGQLQLAYLNPAAEAFLDTSARQSLGLELEEFFQDHHYLQDRLTRALSSNHPYTERDLQITLTDGTLRNVDCTVTPIGSTSDRMAIVVEMQPIDRHLRILREESLLEQGEVMRELVRGLAHEIKNPLGGLRGAAQLLERELNSEELKEYTQVIIGEADRLRQLVNRMLGPSARPEKSITNIHHVLEHVRNLVRAEAGSGLELTADYDPSIPELEADTDLLIQAVLNIVRNAVEAMQGQGTITLRTRTKRQFTIGHTRHRLVMKLEIIDNGPGVSPDLKDKMFLPMVTGRSDGTGLGLSIAQSLVNIHGGLIECESEPGRTVFTVYLPVELTNV